MRDTTAAIGTAQSVRSVVLATEISGQIETLDLESGTYVERGALIAELDDQAARITLDRAALMMADQQRNYDRRAQLRSSGSVTDLQLQEADLARKSAELSLREAEFELRRHRITAPISGWVGLLTVGAGDLVASGARIATIEDRSSLLVEFRVPERLASRIVVGDPIEAAALADPGAALQGRISAIDNRVDAASRSLKVQATLPNDSDRLRPGMAISLSIELTGDSYPAIDPLAIQWGANGAYVWVLRDGKAAQMPIRIVQRNAEDALVEAAFAAGDLVVTEGVMALRPGAPAVAAEPAGSVAGEPSASGG
jgi:RND family efflux transporter MFP subunit